MESIARKGAAMSRKTTIITVLVSLIALAIPAAGASAKARPSAVVFSQAWTTHTGSGSSEEETLKGGLFAVRDGHFNQLTEDPGDVEPSFSGDGRTIAYARNGDLFSVRPDGS